MRKITKQSVSAFVDGYTFKGANTRVEIRNGESFMYLHDNMIAHKGNDFLYITNCGWRSNTTKERLNGVLAGMNIQSKIYQKDFTWYIGDETFEGYKLFKI